MSYLQAQYTESRKILAKYLSEMFGDLNEYEFRHRALQWSCRNKCSMFSKYILDEYTNIHASDAMFYGLFASNDVQTLNCFFERFPNVNVNVIGNFGKYAIGNGQVDVYTLLYEKYPNLGNIVDFYKILESAIQKEDYAVFKWIIENCKLNADTIVANGLLYTLCEYPILMTMILEAYPEIDIHKDDFMLFRLACKDYDAITSILLDHTKTSDIQYCIIGKTDFIIPYIVSKSKLDSKEFYEEDCNGLYIYIYRKMDIENLAFLHAKASILHDMCATFTKSALN